MSATADSLFALAVAGPADVPWAWARLTVGHYLGRPPDARSRPLTYLVGLAGRRVGVVCFGRPEAGRCYKGELTYGSARDVAGGRARFDRWEVLCLSRLWLSAEVQPGGRLYGPAWLPGFLDRRGIWRSTLASRVLGAALGRVGFDYLRARPPCFPDQPYAIRAVLSY